MIVDVGAKEQKSASAGEQQFRVQVANEIDEEGPEYEEVEERPGKKSWVAFVALLDISNASTAARPLILVHTVGPDATYIVDGRYPWFPPGNRPANTGVLAHFMMQNPMAALGGGGWVARSNARPLRAQVVLHRARRGDQTPPPHCFACIKKEDHAINDMPAEVSDHDEIIRVTKPGKRVGMPRTDAMFQRLISKVVIRRD
ncbi:hypothetical protein Q9L58_008222 [Maublancomyces gigas]|uniref:Uncharacterized protein n=1 Tax=Discina gigas TaxID=1032678 RepID=A0ABR3GAA9_9PEZI